jgi:hypothetical protein
MCLGSILGEGVIPHFRRFASILVPPAGSRCLYNKVIYFRGFCVSGVVGGAYVFTREYTKCTAGSTFCFVVVVVVLGKPLIKLASISADS